MGFHLPAVLLLLPLVPLVVRAWSRRPTPAVRFPDVSLVTRLPRGRARFARGLALALRTLTLTALVVAAAGPRYPDERTRLSTDGIAIAVVCDVSGSMAEADFLWTPDRPAISRLEAARRAFRLFVAGGESPAGERFDGRPADTIALVTFAASPRTECPLTLNHSVLLSVSEGLTPTEAGLDAGTNLGDALAEGLIRLKTAGDRKKVLIVLSDGEHNAAGSGPDGPLAPRQAAQLAANLAIPVYTIDCGGDPDRQLTPDDTTRRADGRAILADVARLTGGETFVANDGPQLTAAYRAIDQLQRSAIASFVYRRYYQLAPACAAVAVGSLILLTLIERLFWRRVPE